MTGRSGTATPAAFGAMISAVEVKRRRTVLGTRDDVCALCGRAGLEVVSSRRVRRGLDLLRPGWEAVPRTYLRCPGCGARRDLDEGTEVPQPRRPGEE